MVSRIKSDSTEDHPDCRPITTAVRIESFESMTSLRNIQCFLVRSSFSLCKKVKKDQKGRGPREGPALLYFLIFWLLCTVAMLHSHKTSNSPLCPHSLQNLVQQSGILTRKRVKKKR